LNSSGHAWREIGTTTQWRGFAIGDQEQFFLCAGAGALALEGNIELFHALLMLHVAELALSRECRERVWAS
jgi:hypothetical protein